MFDQKEINDGDIVCQKPYASGIGVYGSDDDGETLYYVRSTFPKNRELFTVLRYLYEEGIIKALDENLQISYLYTSNIIPITEIKCEQEE